MIRAVIDTNVVVSGLISSNGNEALVLSAIHQGIVRPCISRAIVDEYASVLSRAKFGFPPDETAALIAMLEEQGEMFWPQEEAPFLSPDAGDIKFLQCAHAAQADFIVTGNKKHFPDSPYGPTRVVNAGELLDLITYEM